MPQCMVVTTLRELAARVRRQARLRSPESDCCIVGHFSHLVAIRLEGAASVIALLTCAYVTFFIVSMHCRNQSAIFEPCGRDL
jgi:hypothetical protein